MPTFPTVAENHSTGCPKKSVLFQNAIKYLKIFLSHQIFVNKSYDIQYFFCCYWNLSVAMQTVLAAVLIVVAEIGYLKKILIKQTA